MHSNLIKAEHHAELLGMTSDIAAAHIRQNPIHPDQLPALLRTIYGALSGLGQPAVPAELPQEPAVPIKASVKPGYVTCLECGFRGKMLKRHLRTEHGLSPEAYRAKWGLKLDHPLTSPNYSARRAELAKSIGLGRNGGGRK